MIAYYILLSDSICKIQYGTLRKIKSAPDLRALIRNEMYIIDFLKTDKNMKQIAKGVKSCNNYYLKENINT